MWTHDETQFLLKNYRELGANKCAEVLSNKTKKAIINKASRLGLKSEVKKSALTSYISWLKISEFELLEPFTKTSDLLLHRHKLCAYEWKVRPNNLSKGQGCPNCSKLSQYTNESYALKLIHTQFEALEDIKGVEAKILHRHKVCGNEWLVRPKDILRGQNCPKCSKNNYSKISIEWLNSLHNSNILHAENGGEQIISGFKVDGYDPTTNTVYEFHGDAFHGNLDVYPPDYTCHPFDKSITADELFQKTFDKMDKISKVANLVYIWESDFKKGLEYVRFT